jgi:hypothetical protein
MKFLTKVCVLLTLISMSLASFAGGSGGATTAARSNQDVSTKVGQDQNSNSVSTTSNIVDLSNHSRNRASDLSKAVPFVTAPSLSTGFNVCDSSASLGLGWSGFGASIGLPINDDQCNRRQDALTMLNMEEKGIAKETMCTSVRIFKASIRAGSPCFPESDMLDELSDSESAAWSQMIASMNAPVVVVPNVGLEDRLRSEMNTKFDNLHRVNMTK